MLGATVAGGVAAGAAGAPTALVVLAVTGTGTALVATHLSAARTAGAREVGGDLSGFPVQLPAERVAVGRLAQVRFLPPTRSVWAPGLLCVRPDDVRFVPAKHSHAERAWWAPVERVSLHSLGAATVVRVHGRDGAAQFVIAQPVDEVRAAIAPYVTLVAPSLSPTAALPVLEPLAPAVGPVDLAVLEPSANVGYGLWPFPCPRDEEVAVVVRALVAPGAPRPTTAQRDVLRTFAERMATLARRELSPEPLRLGLAAAALTADVEDVRDTLLVLPLLWRSAEVLGYDPRASFRAAHAAVGRGPLAEFATRPAADRGIDVMGYVEVDDADGFRYERTW